MSLLVIGKSGQLSNALAECLPDAVFIGQETIDLSHPGQVRRILAEYTPTGIINAAAYTQVDKAEQESELAYAINAESVRELARFCKERAIPLVHVSTDYVFDGSGHAPRTEETPCAPLNIYGASKRLGEEHIEHTGGEYIILRTSWVYDDSGKNFLNTMLRLGAERETLTVVDDQVGGPTYALHLAQAIAGLLPKASGMAEFPSGIYHACGGGETSWCGFAREIFRLAREHGAALKVQEVTPILTAQYPTPAKRPLNSRLDCSKLENIFGIRLPDWRAGLKQCMARKYADH